MAATHAAPTHAELRAAYRGKRVLITGHTGFKGGWLTLWLNELGAEVTGFALPPDTKPALFEVAQVQRACRHVVGDVRDATGLDVILRDTRPDYVFHLAAQPLVRQSYAAPRATIETNVMGTVNLLEAVRQRRTPCAVVVVTSDKCYENREWIYGYREHEPMGGHDIYSMSKGACELVVAAYRRSFFAPSDLGEHGVALASARSGNVIGGGDWAVDRIVPDAVRALATGEPVRLRNPRAVRPWQHVLEPLGGYLLLAARLAGIGTRSPARFCEAFNFGPAADASPSVRDVAERLIATWGHGACVDASESAAPHEAGLLRLSCEKANLLLDWRPRWGFNATIEHTARWYRSFYANDVAARTLCQEQIAHYTEAAA